MKILHKSFCGRPKPITCWKVLGRVLPTPALNTLTVKGFIKEKASVEKRTMFRDIGCTG